MQGLEPILQDLRIRKVSPYIHWGGTLIDFGCDYELTLINRVKDKMEKVIGIDIVSEHKKFENVEIIPADLEKKVPLPANTADTITMLAVLEHLPHPDRAVNEAYRLLKRGGVFLVTVPSPRVEKILPVLAKFGLVRDEMIEQHENYFTHEHLCRLAEEAGFSSIQVESWELGCNTFLKATK
ncbi:MAG: class I SAM-dependent methyltransferase [bacterium]|nr:class I SAM-dependent methyltransferase [bacterium]